MKSLFAKQKSKANLQRNAFDLSYSNKFTASPGMLLPCYVQEVNPNEHFVISPQSFLRTMPLNTASFVRAKQNIEFYFVPYRLLCRQFPQFVVGTEYKISSLSGLNDYKNPLPTFDLSVIVSTLAALCKNNNNDLDIAGMPIWRGAVRLLDLLGYGVNLPSLRAISKDFATSPFDKTLSVNPLRLLAYQKIYYDFYRNPMYELNNPDAYNIDGLFDSGSLSVPDFTSYTTGPSNNQMFVLRYRNWKKDYFNCVSPYFQGADWLSDAVSSPILGYDIQGTSNLKPFTSSDINSGIAQSFMYNNHPSGNTSAFSIANLRSAYALDKLYRLSIAAGDGDYGSQIRAHYGFDVPYDNCKSRFIGGISEPISISEVITTATTADAPTGDIYGKGLSANSGQRIVFDTKEHGIIMGIFSVVPEADYNANGVDKFNMKINREDYYQPEFADLGLAPLSLYEYAYCAPWNRSDDNRTLGYIPRYAEYKTRVDYVHGEFESYTEQSSGENGKLSAWVAPRQTQLSGQLGASNAFFKIKPNIWNNITSLAFKGKEEEDIFIVDFRANVQAVRPMSVSGLPSL
nr:MAG: major capsid protein [Microvirus sp.]